MQKSTQRFYSAVCFSLIYFIETDREKKNVRSRKT